MDEANILSRIPGEYIAAAGKPLPQADTAAEEIMESVIEVAGHGTVRFTFKRFRHKHGKSHHCFWTAERAVRVM